MLRTKDKSLFLGGRMERVLPRSRPVALTSVGAGTTAGVTVATHASANTKAASYTEITSATTVDADGFWLNILLGANAVRDFLIDIAIGGAGAETNILSNILLSSSGTTLNDVRDFYVPIPIKAGTRISGNAQCSTGGESVLVVITLATGDMPWSMRCQRSQTYGANTADSGGVSIDPGGSAGTKGAWAQLSASTTDPIDYALVFIGGQVNTTRSNGNHLYDVGTGANPNEVVVIPDMYSRQNATVDCFQPGAFARHCPLIPAGTRLVGRGSSSLTDATDRLADMVVIGFNREPAFSIL